MTRVLILLQWAALKKLQGILHNVSYQFLRWKIEGQNAKLFVSITRNSANTYKKMHAFFGANEGSWFEDVERTVTGFLPDKMVTQIF